jgi:hypothetical protein
MPSPDEPGVPGCKPAFVWLKTPTSRAKSRSNASSGEAAEDAIDALGSYGEFRIWQCAICRRL